MITARIRDLLIEHIDGPVPFRVRPQWHKDFGRPMVVKAAIKAGLLRPDCPHTNRPRFTVITEAGREQLSKALADWADAIIRAQYNRESLPPLIEDFLPESAAKSA